MSRIEEDDSITSVTFKLNHPAFGEFTIAWGEHNQMLAIEGADRTTFRRVLEFLRRGSPSEVREQPRAKVEVKAEIEVQPEATKTASPAEAKKTEDPKQPVADGNDFSVFLSLQKLADIVTEVMRRGANDFESIKAYIAKVDDSEMCPALDRIKRQGDFDSRLRTHCTSRQIPGAL